MKATVDCKDKANKDKAECKKGSNMLLIVLIVVVIILAIAISIFLWKRKNSDNEPEGGDKYSRINQVSDE